MADAEKIVPFFTRGELKCKCGRSDCSGLPFLTNENMFFLRQIAEVRRIFGVPLIVNSYFRCSNHPVYKSNSAHSFAMAIDLSPRKKTVHDLYFLAEKFNFFGIGIQTHGPRQNQFLHVDWKGSRRARWYYDQEGISHITVYREEL